MIEWANSQLYCDTGIPADLDVTLHRCSLYQIGRSSTGQSARRRFQPIQNGRTRRFWVGVQLPSGILRGNAHSLTILFAFSAALSKHAANDGKSLRRMPEIQAYGVNGVQE